MSSRLFIGNLNFSITEDDLVQALASMNVKVSNVRVIRDRETQQSRGFAFAEVEEGQATAVIQTANGAMVHGRSIRVDFATERASSRPTPRERDVAETWTDDRRRRR